MSIRFAKVADIPELVEGGRRMHALTRFKAYPYEAALVAQAFEALIQRNDGRYGFFVAVSGNQRVVGALVGVIERQLFSSLNVASVMHFDVLPEARMGGHGVRLLRAFELWAKNRLAVEISFGINSEQGMDTVSRFAMKMGYKKVGENFVKEGRTL